MKPLEALRALGPGRDAPAEAKQRVYGALLASLEAAAAGTVGAAAAAKASALVPHSAAPALAGIASTKALLIGAGIWLIGGATGAALYGAFQHEQVRVVYVDRPVALSPTPTLVPSSTPLAAPQLEHGAPSAAPVAASAHNGATAPTSSAIRSEGSQLARERAVLDLARAAAARGEPALALEQAERHRQQFPQGRLAEEREAMAIRALIALGRGSEARARADAFRASYPNSFLTPVIDSALSAP